jgi:hypothetical protein
VVVADHRCCCRHWLAHPVHDRLPGRARRVSGASSWTRDMSAAC